MAVADNSEMATTRQEYRDMLRGLAKRWQVSLRYIGLEEKGSIRAALCRCDIRPDVIEFMLGNVRHPCLPAIGGNYNALLLATLGEPVVAVDDDTICETAICYMPLDDSYSDEETWSSSFPFEVAACSSLQEAVDAVVWEDIDFLGSHARALGSTADHDGRTRQTRLTLNGMVGDCGWASPSFYLLMTGASLKHLTAGGYGPYRKRCSSRYVIKFVRLLTTVVRVENMMCMSFGFDHRKFIPPFLPIGRGCDHVFGVLTASCCQGAAVTYLPVLIRHAPMEIRRFSPNEVMRSSSGVDLGFVIGCLIKEAANNIQAGQDHARAEAVGSFLRFVAEDAGAGLRERLRRIVRPALESYIEALERRARVSDSRMRPWIEDVERVAALQRRCAREDRYVVPLDVLLGQDLESATSMLRQIINSFGRLLSEWNAITAAAADVARCEPLGTQLGGAQRG